MAARPTGKSGKTASKKASARRTSSKRGKASARPTPRKPRKKRKAPGRLRKAFGRAITRPRVKLGLRILAVLAFVFGVLVSQWLLGLDSTVRGRFEGQQFRVASRVMSAPSRFAVGGV